MVKPAFPNNDGVPHPENVSKIYFREGNADEALITNAGLQSIGIPQLMFPYERTFKGSNVPEFNSRGTNLRAKCQITSPESPIKVLRMKNLGSDFVRLINDKALVAQIQTLSLSTVLRRGVRPLFETIAALRSRGLIHNDVRFENVMIDPATGIMTLIDYGLLMKDDQMKDNSKALGVYYQFPPEVMLWLSAQYKQVYQTYQNDRVTKGEERALKTYKQYINKYDLYRDNDLEQLYKSGRRYATLETADIPKIIEDFTPSFKTWVKVFPHLIYDIQKHEPSAAIAALKQVTDAHKLSNDTLINAVFTKIFDPVMEECDVKGISERRDRMAYFKEKSIDTIDSYGIGLCVLLFFGKYFAKDANWMNCPKEIRDALYARILVPMIEINYKGRLHIDEALDLLDQLIDMVEEHEGLVAAEEAAEVGAEVAAEEGPAVAAEEGPALAAEEAANEEEVSGGPLKRRRIGNTPANEASSSGGRRSKKLKSRRRPNKKRRRTIRH